MANWNNPTLATDYALFLSELKARDVDAASLFSSLPTNPIAGMIHFERSGGYRFQEYSAGSWVNRALSVAGGGTGATDASGARTALGLGTIAVQDASNVAITGGAITGINFPASVITSGNFNPARMPTGGNWATLVSQLVLAGHAFKVAGFSAGVRGSSSTTLTDTDFVFVSTGGTVTFPDASGIAGRIYIVKRDGTQVDFATTSSQTIDGAAPSTISLLVDQDSLMFQSDGANWNIIGTTGGGGVIEIVHNDASFGSGELTKQFTIPWTGPLPLSAKQVSFTINEGLDLPHAANGGRVLLSWEVDDEEHVTITRTYGPGATGTITAQAYKYTATHHKTGIV